MAQTLDGVSSTVSQHGAKQLSLPLQQQGNFYATQVRRQMIASPASAYAPIRGTQTSYVALLKDSDDLSQGTWTKNAATGTASAATSPEGSTNASKLAEDNTNAAHNATQTLTVATGNLRAVVLLKAGERSFARLRFFNATDNTIGATVFNLSTGAVVSGSGQIKALLNGWFACFTSATATVANSAFFIDLSNDGSTFSYLGTTGSGVYVWRATAYLATAYGPAVQTTSTTRAVTSGPVDDDDPTAFLVDEMEPDSSTLELGVARWGRIFANVPADVVTYGSRVITKPNASTLGTSLGTIKDYTVSDSGPSAGPAYSYLGYAWGNNQVFIRKAATASVTNASGGTFTITFGANTTGALAYNETDANIAAAINGLASVSGAGITVSVTNTLNSTARLAITLTVGNTAARFTMNAGSLTPAASSTAFTVLTNSTSQTVRIASRVTIASHGFSSSGNLLASETNGDATQALLPYTTHWVVIDSNTIAVNPAFVQFSAAFAGAYYRAYTPGTDRVGTQLTQKFYLPGMTLGIGAETDIPIPAVLLNDADFLAAVLANLSGYLTYDANDLTKWLGQIYTQTITAINMGDV